MSVAVRDIRREDEQAWRRLWAEYLTFYKQDIEEEVTAHTWSTLFDETSPYWALVAVNDEDKVIGFGIHQHFRSTWSIAHVTYLEDLFVDASARGSGAGRALIETGKERAKAMGHCSYFWQTDLSNETAQFLYNSIAGGPNDRITYEVAL